jgi:hypothetical protein
MSLWIDRLFSIGGYHLVSEPLQFYRAWSILMIFIAIGWLISVSTIQLYTGGHVSDIS